MPQGSCLCGGLKINYSGDPAMKAVCHCVDCQKISGSSASTNVVVPQDGFQATGPSKTFDKKADSGKNITSYFCPTCGTTVYRDAEAFPGLYIIKAGVLDGGLADCKPDVELYAHQRAPWLSKIEGTEQVNGMPSS